MIFTLACDTIVILSQEAVLLQHPIRLTQFSDNACIESFHSLIKREWLNRFRIENYAHAYKLVFEYIEVFYNTVRIHSHCDYMSPDQFEKLYASIPA